MNVGELRTALANLSDDLQVVLSQDSEGNGFSPLDEEVVGLYTPTGGYCGEFEEAEDDGTINAVCLWPLS